LKPKILFLTTNGLLDQLGSSQILPYVLSLSSTFNYVLLSIEKKSSLLQEHKLKQLKDLLRSKGIVWYKKGFSSYKINKLFDLLWINILYLFLLVKFKPDLVHLRSYRPALLLYPLLRLSRKKYFFDIRGFEIDQMEEMNSLTKESILYKLLKRYEKKIIENASGINVLSKEAKEFMINQQMIDKSKIVSVVSTCVDHSKFSILDSAIKEKQMNICWLGNAGKGYRFNESVKFLNYFNKNIKRVNFLIINKSDHDLILKSLNEFSDDSLSFELVSSSYEEIPEYLNTCSGSLFFYEWKDTGVSSVPTRLGELLACGVPCLSLKSNRGYFKEIEDLGCMTLMEELNEREFNKKGKEFLNLMQSEDVKYKCRKASEKFFSLDNGIREYLRVIQEIIT
jgi:glycosyltransferase involved in cell wall biosynthesis